MDAQQLRELAAAIVAHHEWLKSEGVRLPAPPDELTAVHMLRLVPGKLANTEAAPPLQAWIASRKIIYAVATSLRYLCALRDRANLAEARMEKRRRAASRVTTASSSDPAIQERFAKQIRLSHDDTHIAKVAPSLKQLGVRLRTAQKKLATFRGDLRRRHAGFVSLGMSHAPGDLALAQWLMQGCEALEADLQFFLSEIEGPAAIEPTGHVGVADNKAWFRARGEAKRSFKAAGATSSLGVLLFPDSFGPAKDLDAKRRRQTRERKEVNRAKKRRLPER
jgi:hypothetical protein